MQHAENCTERRANIMQDPRNWLPDNINPGNWMAAMMDLPVLPHGAGQAPPQLLIPLPVGPQNPADPPQAGLLGMLQMMHDFAQNHGQANANPNPGNPNVGQGQNGQQGG